MPILCFRLVTVSHIASQQSVRRLFMSQKRENDIWVDCLQYANWSEQIFQEMQTGQVDCVHVTIAYHENFRKAS